MQERVTSSASGGGISPGGSAAAVLVHAPHRVLSRWGLLLIRGGQGVLAGLVRRPGRVLGVGVLLALTGLGFGVAGLYVWAGYHLRAGRSSLGKYHSSEAAGHLRACLEVCPRDPEALLLAARAARRLGDLDRAEEYLERLERVSGATDDLVLERVLLGAERGDLDGVGPFCAARVEQDDPAASLILEALTRGAVRMYRLKEADESLGRWLEREPNNTQALLLQGSLHDLRGQLADALTSYRKVLELDPEHDEARGRLTGLLVQMGLGEEALPHLEYLKRRYPEDPLVEVRLARCRELLGQQEEAVQLLDGVLARQPRYPPALVERSRLARQRGQLAQAEVWLRQAVAGDPSDFVGRYQLYLCLEQRGKEAEAREQLNQLKQVETDLSRLQKIVSLQMQRSPHDPALHYETGVIALRAGAMEEGLRWLHSALKEDPRHGPTHRALAAYYQRVGRPGLAAQHRALAEEAAGH